MTETSTITGLLRSAAAAAGDRPALLGVGRRPLPFPGLIQGIEAMARSLRSAGLAPGDRVALSLPDGPETAAAFLGVSSVLAAAPLNPRYKEEELSFFLSDLKARAIVLPAGVDSAARRTAQRLGIGILDLEADAETAGLIRFSSIVPAGDPLPSAPPADIALLLHTSGTTARPKLVPLTQWNLASSARNVARSLALTPSDRCLAVMPFFHIHGLVAALLASLSAGGSVACSPGFEAPSFFDWMDELEPTWYTAVPTMHQAVLARAPRHADVIARLRLRFVRSSSAALPPQVFAALEGVFGAPVIEAYGMTEAAHQMASNPLPPGARKPGTVGLPAGPQIAILDPNGDPVPPGARGEVAIRGANVTPGYVENPEANVRAFTSGWFRTGDEGSIDADGYLTLTGRLKEVINRAGEKISPREIDEVLLDHPAVVQAVAFAVPDASLGEDVAAAVVLRDGSSADAAELREFAAGRLADFKVPRRILLLAEIPKGPTGKIQRIGLAQKLDIEGAAAPAATSAERIAPRNPIERELSRIWREVLRVEEVGVTDDFFALGGDSVLAARVAARVVGAFNVELSLAALFDASTVEKLAARVEARLGEPSRVDRPIAAGGPGACPVVSFAQEQLWFHEQLDPGRYNRSTNFSIRGSVDRGALERALVRIAERHEVLRCTYVSEAGVPVPVVSPRAEVPFEFEDLSDQTAPDRESAIRRHESEQVERLFDLEKGPLIRAVLLRLSPDEHVLLVTIHHIAFDRWSVGVFASELAILHDEFSRGAGDPLRPLPIQYGDFARWERERIPRIREAHLEFWRRRLADAPRLELPVDRADGGSEPARFGTHRFAIEGPLVAEVAALSRRANASLFMTLLAAYDTLLFVRTGQTDLVVASNSDKRLRIETEPLIGFFADLIVFRTDLSGGPPFLDALARVRETALETYRYQELPFSRIVTGLRPPRPRNGGIPFARSTFALNTRLPAVTGGATTFEPLAPAEEAAGYDLSLFLEQEKAGVSATWKYDARRFEPSTIAGLSKEYLEILTRVAKDPRVSLDVLRSAPRPAALRAANDFGPEPITSPSDSS